MTFTSHNLIYVYYHGSGFKQLMGRLLLKNRQIFFEYDGGFIKAGLELSPFKLPLKAGVIMSTDRIFEGLFGVFNDSLPDGWGRLLLDRKLMSLGQNPGALSPLDRLCFVGSHGMGEGKTPTKEHLLKLANLGNIKKDKALEIINQILEATYKWKTFATQNGVSELQTKHINKALDRIKKAL